MAYRTVSQLIHRRDVVALGIAASVREICHLMAEQRVGAALVIEDGVLKGIFTERDLLTRVVAAGVDPDRTSVAEVMTPNPVTVEPQLTAVDALRLMTEIGFRHLPIVESGHLHGVISLRDFIGAEFQMAGSERASA